MESTHNRQLLDLGYYGQPIITVEKLQNGLHLFTFVDGDNVIQFNHLMLDNLIKAFIKIKGKTHAPTNR
jgi:hypothetical protein